MKPGARAAAAIEILEDLERRRRPAADAVRDWMLAHRFAGARDRSAIGDLVFGALRWRSSSSWRFGASEPRSWTLGALRWGFGLEAEAVVALFVDDPNAPAPLSEAEIAALEARTPASRLEDAPAWVRGDYPEWLEPAFERAFGETRGEEGAALAAPAPLDLRANRLKADRDRVMAALAESPKLATPPEATPFAPDGVRLPWTPARSFPWASDPAFLKGWFEVQDEGSQLAALLCGAGPGMQVGDVCAGGGGKTLALAAAMANKGQIYAYDPDPRRLAPVRERIERAGVRNVQLRNPRRSGGELADLTGKLDLVLVDAPCTGSGTWRRNPDAKWRLTPNSLSRRLEEQRAALALAAPLVKPGGRLVYVTCSVLPEENEDAVAGFTKMCPEFSPLAPEAVARQALGDDMGARLLGAVRPTGAGLQMSSLLTGCDGFFVSVLHRAG